MPAAEELLETAFRTIIREEVEAALARRDGEAVPGRRGDLQAHHSEPVNALPGVDRFSLVPYAKHVLQEAGGGPLHCADIATRVYALGFEHKWPPKHSDQLVRSINALASPSQHPDRFERVAPRVLKLRSS